MKKRVMIALASIILLTLSLVFVNQIPQGQDSFATIYPWSYAVTVDLNDGSAESITLPLLLLDSRHNSKRTDPKLFSAQIISKSDLDSGFLENGMDVTITEITENGKINVEGGPVYRYDFSASVPLTSNFVYKDAHLVFLYNDGSSEAFYLGDLSFINTPHVDSSPHLRKLRALPVLNMQAWEMTALIIEFMVEEEICLESFDFGLPKYGISTERVIYLKEDMDKLEKMYFDQNLDQEFEGIYSLPRVDTRQVSLGGLVMEPGVSTLVIPFNFVKGENFSPISVLGGNLCYSVNDVQYTYIIESIPYVTGVLQSAVEEYVNNVRQ
jgi:hypothetical protein